jgi:hypothetical protein
MRTRTFSTLDAAYAAGVRYVDAARSYGRAEEFLAGWLAQSRALLGDRLSLYQVHSLTRSLRLEDTLDGAGTLRGEMSPECTAALHAVLDVLSRPCGKEDGRTRDERLHDGMHQAMLRLLGARDLLPRKGGAPVTALVHMSRGDLRRLDDGSVMEAAWIDRITQQFAGHRAAKAETGGDGGAWISGPAAAGIACDAALFPIVTGNADTSHLRGLIDTCVDYWHLEHAETAADASETGADAAAEADTAEAGVGAGRAGGCRTGLRTPASWTTSSGRSSARQPTSCAGNPASPPCSAAAWPDPASPARRCRWMSVTPSRGLRITHPRDGSGDR